MGEGVEVSEDKAVMDIIIRGEILISKTDS